jgi:hypothetical protein
MTSFTEEQAIPSDLSSDQIGTPGDLRGQTERQRRSILQPGVARDALPRVRAATIHSTPKELNLAACDEQCVWN